MHFSLQARNVSLRFEAHAEPSSTRQCQSSGPRVDSRKTMILFSASSTTEILLDIFAAGDEAGKLNLRMDSRTAKGRFSTAPNDLETGLPHPPASPDLGVHRSTIRRLIISIGVSAINLLPH